MPRVAVLWYQKCDPPAVNGVRKPKKPSGYRDCGEDIAYCTEYVLRSKSIGVVTPKHTPEPKWDERRGLPDTESGTRFAVEPATGLVTGIQ